MDTSFFDRSHTFSGFKIENTVHVNKSGLSAPVFLKTEKLYCFGGLFVCL